MTTGITKGLKWFLPWILGREIFLKGSQKSEVRSQNWRCCTGSRADLVYSISTHVYVGQMRLRRRAVGAQVVTTYLVGDR